MVDFLQPVTLNEAVKHLEEKKNLKILAGGTDLILALRDKRVEPDYVMDVKRIPELLVLEQTSKGLEIGAGVHCNKLLKSNLLTGAYDVLRQGVATLANHPLRNRATVVGNIVNASPLGDTLTATLVLDGYLVTISPRREREIKLEDFYKGPGHTVLEQDELVVKLVLPPKDGVGLYKKKQRVKGHDLAQVGVAAFYNSDGQLSLSFGAVGPTPIFVRDFGTYTKEELADAKAAIVKRAGESISPISDVRSSKEYRSAMVEHFTGLIVDELSGRVEVKA